MLENLLLASTLAFNQPTLPPEQYFQKKESAIYAQASERKSQLRPCGTQEEAYHKSPIANPGDLTVVIDYPSKIDNKQKFTIEFYINPANSSIYPESGIILDTEYWVNKKDFYAFAIFEHDKEESKKFPTASGYFRDSIMFVLYDFVNRKLKSLPASEPDGYIDEPGCYNTKGKEISSLIAEVIGTIAERRATQSKIQSKKNK